jgi:hypothetical protein
MNRFRVWICPSEDFCDIRVDGISNAHWLLNRLGREFVFKTFESIREEAGTCRCLFQVPYKRSVSPAKLEQLLASIPPVQLIIEPQHVFQKLSRQRGDYEGQKIPGMTT